LTEKNLREHEKTDCVCGRLRTEDEKLKANLIIIK